MNSLKDAKVLVTGGAGFIGSHLVDGLLKEDVGKIIIIDNLIRGTTANLDKAFEDDRVVFVQRDLLDHHTLDYVMFECDYVFHLAGVNEEVCNSSPEVGLMANIISTFNVLRAAEKNKIKKIGYLTPTKDYGDFYSATKKSIEKMIQAFHTQYGLNYTGVKCGDVYGDRQNVNKTSKQTDVADAVRSLIDGMKSESNDEIINIF